MNLNEIELCDTWSHEDLLWLLQNYGQQAWLQEKKWIRHG